MAQPPINFTASTASHQALSLAQQNPVNNTEEKRAPESQKGYLKYSSSPSRKHFRTHTHHPFQFLPRTPTSPRCPSHSHHSFKMFQTELTSLLITLFMLLGLSQAALANNASTADTSLRPGDWSVTIYSRPNWQGRPETFQWNYLTDEQCRTSNKPIPIPTIDLTRLQRTLALITSSCP